MPPIPSVMTTAVSDRPTRDDISSSRRIHKHRKTRRGKKRSTKINQSVFDSYVCWCESNYVDNRQHGQCHCSPRPDQSSQDILTKSVLSLALGTGQSYNSSASSPVTNPAKCSIYKESRYILQTEREETLPLAQQNGQVVQSSTVSRIISNNSTHSNNSIFTDICSGAWSCDCSGCCDRSISYQTTDFEKVYAETQSENLYLYSRKQLEKSVKALQVKVDNLQMRIKRKTETS